MPHSSSDALGSSRQLVCLVATALSAVEGRQVVERDDGRRMVVSQRLLIDLQSALVRRLRLVVTDYGFFRILTARAFFEKLN